MKSNIHFNEIVGTLNPLNQNDIKTLQSQTLVPLPSSYQAFLQTYGYGSINELILFWELDSEYMQNNFADMLDFWDWENGINPQWALDGVMICTTIDGDIILLINHVSTPFLILPRGIPKAILFATLEDVVAYYAKQYKFDSLYFNSSFISEAEEMAVQQGIDDFENGRFVPHEEVEKIYKKWL